MDSATSSEADFRVAVFAAPAEPQELGQVLSEVLGMHPTNAAVHARSAPGLLPDCLSREEAERLAAAIERTGLHAAALPASEVPDLTHSEVVHHARCLDVVLQILELHGQVEAGIPWGDVMLLSAGMIPLETAKHFEASAVSAARRTTHPPLEVSLSEGPELWIACDRPLRIYRIDHKRMNYEWLGERMTDSATANFRLFLESLVRHAPHAYLTPATRAYLEHRPEGLYHFDTAEQLQHATQFHLLNRLRMRPPAGD
jgi:hypothetical protein